MKIDVETFPFGIARDSRKCMIRNDLRNTSKKAQTDGAKPARITGILERPGSGFPTTMPTRFVGGKCEAVGRDQETNDPIRRHGETL